MLTEISSQFSSIFSDLKSYVNERIAIMKLEIVERAATEVARFYTFLILTLFAFSVLIILGVALGFGLSALIGSYAWGFLLAALVWLVLLFVCFTFRKKLMIKPITNQVVTRFYANEEESKKENA